MKPSAPKPSLKQRCKRTALLCVGIYLLACLGCATYQRHLIYFPPVMTTAQVDEFAKGEGLERWKDLCGKTIGWKRASPVQPAKGQILVTHGNAGCAFQCGHYSDAIQAVAPFDVYILEYPGYADRPGAPSERTLYQAADEGFQLLATNGSVYVVGESLGNGVAAYLAGKHPDKVAGVALLAPYNRLAAVAQAHMPIFPVRLLLVDRFPAEVYLRNYHGPVAVLVGGQDEVIPQKFGRRLYDAYSGPKRLWQFPAADHGTVMLQPPEIWSQIVAFWRTDPR